MKNEISKRFTDRCRLSLFLWAIVAVWCVSSILHIASIQFISITKIYSIKLLTCTKYIWHVYPSVRYPSGMPVCRGFILFIFVNFSRLELYIYLQSSQTTDYLSVYFPLHCNNISSTYIIVLSLLYRRWFSIALTCVIKHLIKVYPPVRVLAATQMNFWKFQIWYIILMSRKKNVITDMVVRRTQKERLVKLSYSYFYKIYLLLYFVLKIRYNVFQNIARGVFSYTIYFNNTLLQQIYFLNIWFRISLWKYITKNRAYKIYDLNY